MKRTPMRLRVAAVIVGLVAALAPAALLGWDAIHDTATQVPVAKSTAAEPDKAPDTTGSSGLIDQSGSLAVAAVLVVLAVGVVAGGRVLSTRRSI